MFTSIKNIASQAHEAVNKAASDVTATGKYCSNCNQQIHRGLDLGLALKGYEKCCIKDCGDYFCTKSTCSDSYVKIGTQDSIPLNFRSMKDGKPNGTCVCKRKCIKILMDYDRRIRVERQENLLEEYLTINDAPIPKKFFVFPDNAKDNTERKAFRVLDAIGNVADVFGMWYVKRALEGAYILWQGNSLLQHLISEDLLKYLTPLMSHFKYLGINKAHDFLTLYYLACKHELDVKSDPLSETKDHANGQPGVLEEACSLDLLDWAGLYLGAASYLYCSRMSKPHHGNEWSEWYLSKLVHRDGWTVISCYNQPKRQPDGTYCPGFAVLARDERSFIHRPAAAQYHPQKCTQKELLICIKGSTDILDWGINVNDSPEPFTFMSGSSGDTPITGHCHKGMLLGVRAILEDYGVRECVKSLVDRGYIIRVVGHSLGAGVAALMVAELLNGFSELYGGSSSSSSTGKKLPDIKGIGFACPAVLTGEISQALQITSTDDTIPNFLSIVNREDLVPRLNLQNLLKLSDEMKAFHSKAQLMYKKDLQSYQKWLVSMGEKPAASKEVDSLLAEPTDESNTNSKNDEKQEKLSSSASLQTTVDDEKLLVPPEAIAIEFVIPGKIIYLYTCHGLDRASLVTYAHPSLHRFKLSIERKIDDHQLSDHLRAITSVRRQYNLMLGSTSSSTSRSNVFRVACPFKSIIDPEASRLRTSAQISQVEELGSLAGPYRSCVVCELPTNWAYIAHSSATTARVTHTCRACGDIVCAICSPAGDMVQGDGLNRQEQLADRRISIPAIGVFERERVCLPCYFQSYFL